MLIYSLKGLNTPLIIDTLRAIVRKKGFINFCKKNGYKLQEIKSNSRISANAKKLLFTKEVTSLYQVITPSGYKNIHLLTPHHLNKKSDYKKAYLVAFGIGSYVKPLRNESKEDIIKIFERFSLASVDIAKDTEYKPTLERLRKYGEVIKHYDSFYINNPLGLIGITKIKCYDKAKKDKLPYPLFRVELTCKATSKLSKIIVNEQEIKECLNYLFL